MSESKTAKEKATGLTPEQREFLLYMMGTVRGLINVAFGLGMMNEEMAAEQFDKLGELAGKADL